MSSYRRTGGAGSAPGRNDRHRVSEETLAEKIMTILRKRRDSGLSPGMTAGALAGRLRVELPALRPVLNGLTASGRVVVDHGPQGLADQRRPDTYSAT
jgi:hypothetical protein